jgi:hypothetical protein
MEMKERKPVREGNENKTNALREDRQEQGEANK